MSSVSASSLSFTRLSVADLTPLNDFDSIIKFDDALSNIQLPAERTSEEIAAQIARQNEMKLFAVFQSNGKIVGNVLENGWSRMESNADGRGTGSIWDDISQFGLTGRDAAEYLTQRLADQLRERYPDLEVLSFDAAQAPTSGDYQHQLAAGKTFSAQIPTVDVAHHQAQTSYDLFSALFLQDDA
ncbi:hypothetical protein HTZ97_14965 [Desulfuromonas acetoxidans]|uniref:Uncharacterized protein n=1 Tax=Desulfuromonas acetoxidans (strain DSM 684 / 11070) TaxID=281689 RepID=Q1JZ03_DESA6|nr:hypothetical protein [Desulfuromonas acetoxidans]EAT15491.1 hypothetical protein Dace_1353 [Desulfuromonas acetoxidans DSM 684]MBF0646677.1 hypothetical protein [Desulfuromonas acetoxidans]NVD25780.1 hypothetical protein [Desulfuromonas acetoxidans]NVE17758.1 hypothetical protein [Desulfuromonas acetoxidans]